MEVVTRITSSRLVHEFTAYLGPNRSRDHGEHEFTIAMERSINGIASDRTIAKTVAVYNMATGLFSTGQLVDNLCCVNSYGQIC